MTDKEKMEAVWADRKVQSGTKKARWVKPGGSGGYELDKWLLIPCPTANEIGSIKSDVWG